MVKSTSPDCAEDAVGAVIAAVQLLGVTVVIVQDLMLFPAAFVAVNVNVLVRPPYSSGGVPVKLPLEEIFNPSGMSPVMLQVIGVSPVAAKVCE
jgi:hypothetical protein